MFHSLEAKLSASQRSFEHAWSLWLEKCVRTHSSSNCPWNFPGKNTGMGRHYLPQGIFPSLLSSMHLLHCRKILYHLSQQRSPRQQYFHIPFLTYSLSCFSNKKCPLLSHPHSLSWVHIVLKPDVWELCIHPGNAVPLTDRTNLWLALPKPIHTHSHTRVGVCTGECPSAAGFWTYP